MPLPIDATFSANVNGLHQYPAKTQQAVGTVAGKVTTVSCVTFADKIMVTITQDGRLAQWVIFAVLLLAAELADMISGPSTS